MKNIRITIVDFVAIFLSLPFAFLINWILTLSSYAFVFKNFLIFNFILMIVWFVFCNKVIKDILKNEKYKQRMLKNNVYVAFSFLFLLTPIYFLIAYFSKTQFFSIAFVVHYIYTTLFLLRMNKINKSL